MATVTVQQFPITINDLPEIVLYSGRYKQLDFYFYNSGSPLNITPYAKSWSMAPYGQPDSVTLTKTGIFTGTPTNMFSIKLDSSDTIGLSGKYIHQPFITLSGSELGDSQGIITIVPGIR